MPRAWVTAIMCSAQFIAPVAAAVEADLAGAGTGPHRDRCGAGEPGVGVLVTEPVHAGGLADDHRGRQHAAAGDRPAGWAPALGPGAAARPRAGLICSFSSAQRCEQLAGDPRDDAVESARAWRCRPDHDARSPQPSGGDHQVGVEFVQVPADLGGDPGPLHDQVPAVVRRAASPPGPVRRARRPAGRDSAARPARPPQRRSGRTCRAPVMPRRSAAISRVGTRTTRQPALSRSASSRRVRWRQSSSANRTSANCADQRTSSRCPSLLVRTVFVAEPPADVVDRDHRVGALVRVGADHDHPAAPPCERTESIQTTQSRARLNRARWQAPIKPRDPRAGRPARPHIEDKPHQQGSKETSEPRRAHSGWH